MDTAPTPPLAELMRPASAAHPDKPALVHKGIALTYRRVRADVARIGARLRALGIGPGDIVAVHLRTPVTHWMVTLALMRIGAVSLTLTREIAPVITALMVTGRAGSAMATEIGSMRITEQIDALDLGTVEQ